MKKLIACVVVMLLASACLTWGATIDFKVVTDKSTYNPGETVNWTMYLYASQGDNVGIAYASAILSDSRSDKILAGSFTTSIYSAANGFDSQDSTANADKTMDVFIAQQDPNTLVFTEVPNIGNASKDGQTYPNLILLTGSYTPAIANTGSHTLTLEAGGSGYWTNLTGGAASFGTKNVTNATFDVVPEPATLTLLGLGGLALLRRRRS